MHHTYHEWVAATVTPEAVAGPGHDEVQTWLAKMPADGNDPLCHMSLLSPDERARAARFRVSGARTQFVFGRVFLRHLLGACLNVEPGTLEFGYAAGGKPFLAHPAAHGQLRFNLSHSHSLVAVALARGREVGVDIEWISCPSDLSLLARRIFSPRELSEWNLLPDACQQHAFFNAWTRKEACLKATGQGLSDALSEVEVTFAPGKEPMLLGMPAGTDALCQWTLCDLPLPPDFAGAVVFEGGRRRLFR